LKNVVYFNGTIILSPSGELTAAIIIHDTQEDKKKLPE